MTNSVIRLGLFPGQGSQKVGMGKDLFAEFPIARDLFAAADDALGFSLSQICFEGPADRLTSTEIAQPAILTVSTIMYRLGCAQNKEFILSAAAGHSLGEYSALVAAGALQFEDAVRLVHKRGSYMQVAVPAGEGKMVAVLGKEVSDIDTALSKVEGGVAEIANLNSPGQVVVAGHVAAVNQFVAALGSATVIELPVSAPFHCRLMQPAQDKLANDLAALKISAPLFPVFANFSAEPSSDPEVIRKSLEMQVTGRVRWIECMQNAINKNTPNLAIEFGSSVLCGLLKRIDPSLRRVPLDSAAALQKIS